MTLFTARMSSPIILSSLAHFATGLCVVWSLGPSPVWHAMKPNLRTYLVKFICDQLERPKSPKN
eukprot:1040013-Amphidinium_carterae.1